LGCAAYCSRPASANKVLPELTSVEMKIVPANKLLAVKCVGEGKI